MDRLRTPEERFDDSPIFPFWSLRAREGPNGGEDCAWAYLDEGPEGRRIVLLMHGDTQLVLPLHHDPGLVANGHRVVAPTDLLVRPAPIDLQSRRLHLRPSRWRGAESSADNSNSAGHLLRQTGHLIGLRQVANSRSVSRGSPWQRWAPTATSR